MTMITNKEEFLRTFLNNEVEDINYVQIDLDITDLSIADIMRNINSTFPINTRSRNAIVSGKLAVAVLCKSEKLDPLSGVLLIIAGDDTNIEIVSKNYIVIGVSESRIVNDDEIKNVVDSITKYLINNFSDTLKDFNEFYVKYVYDPYEMEADAEEEPLY